MNNQNTNHLSTSSQIHNINLKTQQLRLVVYRPILRILDKIGLHANHITIGRLIGGIGFLFWFFSTNNYIAPSIFILCILFADTFDGSLARYQNKFSDRGKFLDVFVDNFVYCFIIFCFLKLGANQLLIAFNLIIIAPTYLLASIKKCEFEISDWIIKVYPRLAYLKTVPIIAFFAMIFFSAPLYLLNYALIFSNILSIILSIYYLFFIQKRWKQKYGF